jgi:EAL domain-containing protein (putative c-di-GMP-specific phosphodiesterase class I)
MPFAPITVSVNVSSRQLEHPGFADDVRHALRSSGLDPQRLVLEITESVIMRDSAVTLERLRELKGLGVRLAIDDFGTGYSSLAYLQRFPVDIIKIDKAFVKSVAISASDAALARAIIMLSETLGLRTVAEGIEDHDQQIALQRLGCELGQGFLFACPLSAGDVRATLRSETRLPRVLRPATAVPLAISELGVAYPLATRSRTPRNSA